MVEQVDNDRGGRERKLVLVKGNGGIKREHWRVVVYYRCLVGDDCRNPVVRRFLSVCASFDLEVMLRREPELSRARTRLIARAQQRYFELEGLATGYSTRHDSCKKLCIMEE